jgi:pentatricopeptide repeat protein
MEGKWISNEKWIIAGIINSYKVLTGKRTVQEVVDKIKYPIFLFDPSNDYTDNDINIMIDYFAKREDYEKCIELKELLK